MTRFDHEALVALFKNRPTLVVELMRSALRVRVPAHDEVRIQSAELGRLVPTEYRADLAVALIGRRQVGPIAAIVLEVQRGRDAAKRFTWPLYLAALRARLRCPVLLVVVCPGRRIASWSRRAIDMGHPGWLLKPLVLAPDDIPWVRSERRARAAPELAVLSVLAHATDSRGPEIALAALVAASRLDDERSRFYSDLVLAALDERGRRALEQLMKPAGYQYKSEFARKYVAEGKAEGETLGRAQGEALGRAQGEALGRAAGEVVGRMAGSALGKAEALLAVFDARGIGVPDDARQRILACQDTELLDVMIRRAATAASLADVLD